jgi:protein-S-isoprenylcysteine O-methyltransferase Ste14
LSDEFAAIRQALMSMPIHWSDNAILLGLWVVYGLVHSLLAGLALKAWYARQFPRLQRVYRLGFNLLAILLLIPIALWIETHPGIWLWRWTGPLALVSHGCLIFVVAGFLWTIRYYDLLEFIGLRQLMPGAASARSDFVISPPHRLVRHPWYFLGLVLVWSRDMNEAGLVSALAITAYFIVGSRYEERKLVAEFGNAYRDYARTVPALLPRLWPRSSRHGE